MTRSVAQQGGWHDSYPLFSRDLFTRTGTLRLRKPRKRMLSETNEKKRVFKSNERPKSDLVDHEYVT